MIEILKMTRAHTDAVIAMMRVFYASDAVHTSGSERIFADDVAECVGESPYLEGYVFVSHAANDIVLGYAMLAKSYSTEFGCPCIWIEDLYLKPEARGKGIATQFFSFVAERYAGAILRLEADKTNASALAVYRKNGFEEMHYVEMKREAR